MAQVVRFDIDFITSFKCRANRELPQRTMKILNMSTKINNKLREKDIKIFNRNLDQFDAEELKKKINSMLNKISGANFEIMWVKINEILKNRTILLEYCINNLIDKAVKQQVFIKVYTDFYKKIYNDKTKEIFDRIFNGLIEKLSKTKTADVGEGAIGSDEFCQYIKDKNQFFGLFLLLSSLYNNKIITRTVINKYITFLETSFETTEDKDEASMFIEAYIKFLRDLGKEFGKEHLIKINEYKKQKDKLKPRMRFMVMDLIDELQ